MRKLLLCIAVVPLIAVAIACKHDDPSQQATAPTATGYPTAYPPPTATYPGAQPGYPTAQPTAYPTAQPTVAPTAPPAGQMATPGPFAFTCQNDVPCGTHHCNMQYQKCAFPCQTAVDCLAPNSCVMGVCVPAPPAQH